MKQHTLAVVSAFILSSPGYAAVSFSFDYSDPSAAANWSQPARDSLENAAQTVSALLVNYNANVPMKVTGSNTDNSTLASAGANYTQSPQDSFGTRGDVAEVILSNGAYILATGAFAGTVEANFFNNWSFGNTVSPTQVDFTSTMIHELTHALGFVSLIAQNGGSEFGQRRFSPLDQYLTNGSGEKVVNLSLASGTGPEWTAASVGGTGTSPASAGTGLYFDGPNAVAANGGNLIPIFSPASGWQAGASGSHLDDDFYTGSNQKLMNANTEQGPGIRDFDPIEIGFLRDIGYAQIIPEPGSALLACLSVIAFCGRRRRAVI